MPSDNLALTMYEHIERMRLMRYPPVSLDVKVQCIDRAIESLVDCKQREDIAMSCPQLFKGAYNVLKELTKDEQPVFSATIIHELCHHLVGEYQVFAHDVYQIPGCSPHWWNGDCCDYYDERIAALTAFKQYLIEQGERDVN